MRRFFHQRLAPAVLIACFLNAASVRSPEAQTPPSASAPLLIGGKPFRLGMSQQEAMASIAECCNTSGSGDSIFIVDKLVGTLGTIAFKNGRVSRLSMDVKQFQSKDVSEFALAFYRTLLDRR